MTIETGTISVQSMSTGENKPYKNPNDVQFKVQYPKDYEGPKYMPDGDTVTISKESAEDFAKRGIGNIVTAEQNDQPKTEETGNINTDAAAGETVNTKPYSKWNKAELQAELTARAIVFDESAKNAELVALLEQNDQPKTEE